MKVLSLATILSKQAQNLISPNDEYFVLSPLDDDELKSKYKAKFIKYEIDTLAFVFMMICSKIFCDDKRFNNVDYGYLSGESNVGEEEIDEILEFLKETKRIIIAPEIFTEINAKSLEFMLGLLCKHFGLNCIDLVGNILSFNAEFSQLKQGRDFNGACVFCYENKQIDFIGSELFAKVAKLKNNDKIILKTSFGEFETTFIIKPNLKGLIAIFSHPKAKNCFEKLRFLAL